MEMESKCAIESLRRSMRVLTDEMEQKTITGQEFVRYMKEGLCVFIDDYVYEAPEYVWLKPDLRLRMKDISFERVVNNKGQSVDNTPGIVNTWQNSYNPLLNSVERYLR